MYVPAHFAELQTEAMHGLIQARPLATLVTLSNEGIDICRPPKASPPRRHDALIAARFATN